MNEVVDISLTMTTVSIYTYIAAVLHHLMITFSIDTRRGCIAPSRSLKSSIAGKMQSPSNDHHLDFVTLHCIAPGPCCCAVPLSERFHCFILYWLIILCRPTEFLSDRSCWQENREDEILQEVCYDDDISITIPATGTALLFFLLVDNCHCYYSPSP